MAWEDEEILGQCPDEFILYKRFIDDLVLIWKGDPLSFEAFRNKMNGNSKNINLSWSISTECINCLDLEIFREGKSLYKKSFQTYG